MKPQSLITSHSSSVHSFTVSFFLLLPSCPNTQLKSKFSSHCRIDSVWTAKLLYTPSHIYPPTPPLSFTPLCIVSITAVLQHLLQLFLPLIFLSSVYPSVFPSFFCLSSSGSVWDRPRGLAWQLGTSLQDSLVAPWGPSQEDRETFIYCKSFYYTAPCFLLAVFFLATLICL